MELPPSWEKSKWKRLEHRQEVTPWIKKGGWSGRKHTHSRVLSHVQNISAKDGQGMKQWLLWGGELDGWGPGKAERPDFHGTPFWTSLVFILCMFYHLTHKWRKHPEGGTLSQSSDWQPWTESLICPCCLNLYLPRWGIKPLTLVKKEGDRKMTKAVLRLGAGQQQLLFPVMAGPGVEGDQRLWLGWAWSQMTGSSGLQPRQLPWGWVN